MNKTIAIIAPAHLPIPAVLSGGIEQLIGNIIEQNEKTPKIFIHIISAYSPLTKELEKKYINTKFHNIRYSFWRRCLNYIDREVLSKILRYQHYKHDINQIVKYIKNGSYDKVVIYGNDHQIKPISMVIEKEKLVYILATLMLNKVKDFSLCERIIVGSNQSKLSVLQNNDKISEKNIRIVQSGIDTEYFKPLSINNNRQKIRQRHKIGEEESLVCYLGRIDASKGVIAILQAAISIMDTITFKLILIGNFGLSFGSTVKNKLTDEELEIRNYIDKLGDKCIVTGFVQNEELIDYLSAVDIGLVPSICEDVSPLTYFQYQAMGIPTIVSDAGGIPEYFSPDFSLMFRRGPHMISDIATCIKEMVENKRMRYRMSCASLKNREHLGIERFYNDFVRIVSE